MIVTQTLGELARTAPTYHASVSAVHCLRDLARNLDLDAIRELARTLGTQMGYEIEASEYSNPQTLAEFITWDRIPGLLRVYAAGFCPRCLVLDRRAQVQLQEADHGFSQFAVFQDLLLRRSPLEHEALRAYVLALCVRSVELGSPASFVSLCDRIMNQCRVVEGRNASSDLEFGRELLLEMTVHSFTGIVGHELGHDREPGPWSQTEPATDRRHFLEILGLLSKLKRSASTWMDKPLAEQDARRTQTQAGLRILYTMHGLDEGVFNHISLSNYGGPLDLDQAALFSYVILCALGIEPASAALAYSPRGLAHLGFLVSTAESDEFRRREVKRRSAAWLDLVAQESAVWLDRLTAAGRVGPREEGLLRILSDRYDVPALYGQVTDLVALDVEACEALRSGLDLRGMTQDDLDGFLCSAVRCGHVQLVEKLLSAGASPGVTVATEDAEIAYAGSSLLIHEVGGVKSYFGPSVADVFAVLEALLGAGIDPDLVVNGDGDTLLIDAAKHSVEAARFLLAHGASVDSANRRGETALHVAARVRNVKMVSQLIAAGADVNRPARNGYTPLFEALQEGADDVAQLLIDSGADVTRTTGTGESVLMFATTGAMTRTLCEAGAGVDAASWDGETALMRAATWGGSEVVRALLDAGADVSLVTDLGETALHCAMRNPHCRTRLETVSSLIEAGADVNAETNDGLTALVPAVEDYIRTLHGTLDDWTLLSFHDSLEDRLQTVYRSYLEAIESDGTAAPDPGRESPTLRGESSYNAAIARRLLGRWRDRQALAGDELGELLLFFEDLMQSGMEWRDAGLDPILARLSGDKTLIRALLEAGADVTVPDRDGKSPLSLVEQLDPDDDVRILIEGVCHRA